MKGRTESNEVIKRRIMRCMMRKILFSAPLIFLVGATVVAFGEDGRKLGIALVEAAEAGRMIEVQELLRRGVDPNARNKDGYTALHVASAHGHRPIVEFLLSHGANINVRLVSSNANIIVMRDGRLVAEKPDEKSGETPLWFAANRGQTEIVKILLMNSAEADIPGSFGETPLARAADQGKVEVVDLLLERSVQVNSTDTNGWTPLFHACQGGHELIVTKLLARGARVDMRAESGVSALSIAAEAGHTAIVRTLLTAGAQVDVRAKNGATPLIAACLKGHAGVVEALIAAGADVNAQANGGGTPLMQAALIGNKKLVTILLAHRANPDAVTVKGDTAADFALRNGHNEIARSLQKLGSAPVRSADDYNNIGISKMSEGRFDEAIENFTKAINLNPSLASAFYHRGTSRLGSRGDPKLALKDFDRAISLNPEDAEPFLARGMVRIRLGDEQGGCNDLRRARDLGLFDELGIFDTYCRKIP